MEEILGVKRSAPSKEEAAYAQVLGSTGPKTKKKRFKEFERLQQELAPDEVEVLEQAGLRRKPGDKSKAALDLSNKKKVNAWTFRSFTQSSRPDNAQYQLRHWERAKAESKDYFACKEVGLKYPGVERVLAEFMASSDKLWDAFSAEYMEKYPWIHTYTKAQVQAVLEMLLKTELRFVVVADRLERPVEQLKFVYYSLAEKLGDSVKKGHFDLEAEVARRASKETEGAGGREDEKTRLAEVRKWQGKLKEVKEMGQNVDKVFEKKPEKKATIQAYFGSEDVLELPLGMAKKFPEAKSKLSGFSQRVKRLCADLAEAQEAEKQAKSVLKMLGGAAAPFGTSKTEG